MQTRKAEIENILKQIKDAKSHYEFFNLEPIKNGESEDAFKNRLNKAYYGLQQMLHPDRLPREGSDFASLSQEDQQLIENAASRLNFFKRRLENITLRMKDEKNKYKYYLGEGQTERSFYPIISFTEEPTDEVTNASSEDVIYDWNAKVSVFAQPQQAQSEGSKKVSDKVNELKQKFNEISAELASQDFYPFIEMIKGLTFEPKNPFHLSRPREIEKEVRDFTERLDRLENYLSDVEKSARNGREFSYSYQDCTQAKFDEYEKELKEYLDELNGRQVVLKKLSMLDKSADVRVTNNLVGLMSLTNTLEALQAQNVLANLQNNVGEINQLMQSFGGIIQSLQILQKAIPVASLDNGVTDLLKEIKHNLGRLQDVKNKEEEVEGLRVTLVKVRKETQLKQANILIEGAILELEKSKPDTSSIFTE